MLHTGGKSCLWRHSAVSAFLSTLYEVQQPDTDVTVRTECNKVKTDKMLLSTDGKDVLRSLSQDYLVKRPSWSSNWQGR